MEETNKREIHVVLFDIGGVLVQVSGVTTMLDWMQHRVSAEEMWRMWLTSPCVRDFETGRISAENFATAIIGAMNLPVNVDQFLKEMETWSVDLYPGALELIHRVSRRCVRATLCNSNAVHWPRLMKNRGLAEAFDHHFASHLIGKIKPDANAFENVIQTLRFSPQAILFIDDNQMNVDAARKMGIHAVRVQGINAAEAVLAEFGVLD